MQDKFQIPEDIELLIAAFLEGVMNEKGLIKLSHWLSESTEHMEQFNKLKSAWLLAGKTISISGEKTESALNHIKYGVKKPNNIKLRPYWSFYRIASSLLLVLTLGGAMGAYLMYQSFGINNDMVTTSISAPLGSKSVVDLPDGTKVWINAGSKITYDNSYGKTSREVKLVGEAYFSVKTNKKIPFLVKTSELIVKALGTKFNVKAYPEEKTITTTLEEGKIVLTTLHNTSGKKVAELKPRQMLIYYKNAGAMNSKLEKEAEKGIETKRENTTIAHDGSIVKLNPVVRTELLTSWKDDTWIIDGEPLGTLVPMLERRFNMVIEFDSEEIKKFKFTGKIQKETIEQIMLALELSSPIHYKIKNNTIIVSIDRTIIERYKQNISN